MALSFAEFERKLVEKPLTFRKIEKKSDDESVIRVFVDEFDIIVPPFELVESIRITNKRTCLFTIPMVAEFANIEKLLQKKIETFISVNFRNLFDEGSSKEYFEHAKFVSLISENGLLCHVRTYNPSVIIGDSSEEEAKYYTYGVKFAKGKKIYHCVNIEDLKDVFEVGCKIVNMALCFDRFYVLKDCYGFNLNVKIAQS